MQRDTEGNIVPGSGWAEEEGFQRALEELTVIFQTWTPFIIFTSQDEFEDYQNRSWCFFELRQVLAPEGAPTP